MGRGWGAIAEVSISPGFQSRMRALVVIPITLGILFAVLLVFLCISESPGGQVLGEEGAEGTVEPATCFLIWPHRLPTPLSLSPPPSL